MVYCLNINVKVALLSRVTSSVSRGNLSAFDVIVGDARLYKALVLAQPRPKGSLLSCAGNIGTPGQAQAQRHSGFEWLCKQNRLRPEPIRFVRLDSDHAQSDGMSVNRGLPELDLARGNLVPRVHVSFGQRQDTECLGADQKTRGLWERDWARGTQRSNVRHAQIGTFFGTFK